MRAPHTRPKPNTQARDGLIHAEIFGDDTATACGLTVKATAPILALCRALIAAGVDPATPLEAWRGPVLALKVRSIGEAARLETDGIGFKRRRAAAFASFIEPCLPTLARTVSDGARWRRGTK
jgi:hypothetical protein